MCWTLFILSLETDWETTHLGYQVELEWRLKVFPRTSDLRFWISPHQGTHSCSQILKLTYRCAKYIFRQTAGFHEYFVGKAFLWDTRETFCFVILSHLIHHISTHAKYTHILKGVLSESHNPWWLEIVIPTILYTIHCGFPQLLPLHIQILERLIAQTLTTPILSVMWGFGAAGKHWKKPFVWLMQSGWIMWSKELEKTRLHQVSWLQEFGGLKFIG